MDITNLISKMLAAQKVSWGDVWKVTVDVKGQQIVVVALDGRKWTQAIAKKRPSRVKAIRK